MATKSISELPSAASLDGTEAVPIVQGPTTVQTTLEAIAALATKTTVGLGNVNNTSDTSKPISTATQNALNGKFSTTGGTISGPTTVSSGNLIVSAGTITASGNISNTTTASTTMTDGFMYIPKAAGPPMGTATVIAGRAPLYFDSTNNKLWIGIGSGTGAASWKGVVVA